ncbi:hypothetical protein [Dyella japonica]|uniref:Uncharacterized protein n=1 Tax=Dyella japonica A8 TaxID=1217721 RepID=A0A075JXL0_9GAMM|nr:hypothetical protein [Dyella japonica]AIF46320.1 hypothetical protein HY57_03145 [Dyella japonica A8]
MSDVQGVLGKDWHRDIRYPLVFTVTRGQKIACWLLGVLFGSMGVGVLFLTGQGRMERGGAFLTGAIGLCLLYVPIYCALYASRARVTLEANAIEVRKAFSRRRVETRDIRGRRMMQGRGGIYPVIVPKAGTALRLEGSIFGLDDRFKAWFNALPDLDGQERTETLAEVSRDASLGASPQERMAKLEKAKTLGKGLGAAATALAFWGFFYPQPYGLVIAAAALVPWVAVLLLWVRPSLFQLDGRPGDVKPNLAALVLMPPLMLAMRAIRDLTVVDLGHLFLWGAVLAAPLYLALLLAPQSGSTPMRGRVALRLLLVPFVVAYGVGLLALTDAMWDHARPEVVETTITGKDVSRGRSTTYYVHLAPWSTNIHEDRIAVTRAYYESAQKGDSVCIRLHPGKFNLRWMQLGGCST